MSKRRKPTFMDPAGGFTDSGAGPWFWRNVTDNLTGTPTSTPGANFTAAANNADGAAVTVLSALAHNVHRVVLTIFGVSLSTADTNALGDLLIDPAGGTNWTSLIDDICVGFTPTGPLLGASHVYDFPLFVPSGASVGFRARCAHTVDVTTGRVVAQVYGNPSRPEMWWYGTGVETLGSTPAASKGTNVTPGNTGTFGAWTTIGASTKAYGTVLMGMNGASAVTSALLYHLQMGYGSAQLTGCPTWWHGTNLAEQAFGAGTDQSQARCDVPSGTTWQARGTCSGVAEVQNLCIYGVYK